MKERENVKKIDELIKELDNVRNSIKCEFPMVDYCVDCHEIVDSLWSGHEGHTILSITPDYDEISSWIECLEWIKKIFRKK
jgi:hypothetical protein